MIVEVEKYVIATETPPIEFYNEEDGGWTKYLENATIYSGDPKLVLGRFDEGALITSMNVSIQLEI